MRKNKILFVVLVGLIAYFAFQSYQLIVLPTVDRELVLNEQSLNEVAQHYFTVHFGDRYDRFFEHLPSQRPVHIQYANALRCCVELFNNSMNQFRLGLQSKYRPDVANQTMSELFENDQTILQEIKFLTNEKFHFTTGGGSNILNDDLAALALYRQQFRCMNNSLIAVDFFSRLYSLCNWTTFEGLMMADLGKPSIHDSLEVIIPNLMRAGLTERVQIAFSKKFINAITDSLKRVGDIPEYYTNTYAVQIDLTHDDLHILPFDAGKKTITEADYSIWEYNLLARTNGVKDLKLNIAVKLQDSTDNTITHNVVRRLRAIEVVD